MKLSNDCVNDLKTIRDFETEGCDYLTLVELRKDFSRTYGIDYFVACDHLRKYSKRTFGK